MPFNLSTWNEPMQTYYDSVQHYVARFDKEHGIWAYVFASTNVLLAHEEAASHMRHGYKTEIIEVSSTADAYRRLDMLNFEVAA